MEIPAKMALTYGPAGTMLTPNALRRDTMKQSIRRKLLLHVAPLALGLAILGPHPAAAQAPIIRTIVPGDGAAGLGQLITIQGFNLGPAGATVTFTANDGGAPSSCVFIFPFLSTSNELYVRLGVLDPPAPPGCAVPSTIPIGKYKVTVTTAAGTSNEVGFQVKAKPHAPILLNLVGPLSIGCPDGVNQIGVRVYGTDAPLIAGVISAVFTQGGVEFNVGVSCTFTGASGLENRFILPAGLAPGTSTLIQLRSVVNGVASDLSYALRFTAP